MLGLVNPLWMLKRDLVSDGYSEALRRIAQVLPLKIHRYATGTRCWTWTVPEKWTVREAFLEGGGKRWIDYGDHPLHVMSYSLPVDAELPLSELMNRLHWSETRPDAIPYEFKFYERDWGLCLPKSLLPRLPKERLRVLIDARFEAGYLEVGEFTIPGTTDETLVVIAHLDHPAQVNDDLTGVAVAVEAARALALREHELTVKFLFVPETIGSVAYLSQNESVIEKLRYGIFLEMLGTSGPLVLQRSWPGGSRIDRVARLCVAKRDPRFHEDGFRKIVGNDEMVFNGPGVGVPTISISRWPYPEYHTSDDNPSIVSEGALDVAKNVVVDIVGVLDTDYVPRRTFRGPVFLSGQKLWVDWRTNPDLNRNLNYIMLSLEGGESVFDIADKLGLDYNVVLGYIERFREKGLVEKRPLRGELLR